MVVLALCTLSRSSIGCATAATTAVQSLTKATAVTCGMGMHILTIPIKDAMEFGKVRASQAETPPYAD